ncbi:hypothetical protein K443DRAFT_670885 [Laccaria amethystina LaAM-08-1]|uniref:DUF6534 domain-containing protein n=1 Tax=Laccaria amethystina LaAM-08-1 TaxID=1095629 RepID=A0A0C9YQC6_9AGAR|nr:hypothetical protein K443DRAFT_670885 [Laccaria amethystina LaAM-08-1]
MTTPMVKDINSTFGAMLIGSFITMVIYGITTLQTYFYYLSFPKDIYWMKLLVALIWFLDTLHVIFMCHSIHFYLITGFGNPAALASGTWSLYTSIAINVLMAFVVQSFFTQRIHELCPKSKRWWVSSLIGFLVLAHVCFGMETVAYFFIKREFSRLREVSISSVLPFGVLAILSDILIAMALCLLLDSNRSDFEDTNHLINKLIVFAINRCILTSAVAVIEMIIFLILPNSFYPFAIDFIIGKLYANSLLATLNSRVTLPRVGSTEQLDSTSFNVASVVHNRGTESLALGTRGSEDRQGLGGVLDKESRHNTTISTAHTSVSRRTYPNTNV